MKDYPLYAFLKKYNLVEDFKDYSYLVYNRQIKVNDILVDNPKYKFDKVSKCQIGHKVITEFV